MESKSSTGKMVLGKDKMTDSERYLATMPGISKFRDAVETVAGCLFLLTLLIGLPYLAVMALRGKL